MLFIILATLKLCYTSVLGFMDFEVNDDISDTILFHNSYKNILLTMHERIFNGSKKLACFPRLLLGCILISYETISDHCRLNRLLTAQ